MAAETLLKKLTPGDIAKSWGISTDKVIGWIRSGQLRAINAATRPNGRPRFLVSLDDLAAFERARTVNCKDQIRSKLRKKSPPATIEFF